MTNKIIDVTSVFTAEKLFLDEKKRLEELALKSKTALDTPVTDKTSYRINHEMQIQVRDERIAIERARKEFTANLDEKKKFAIERERELTTPLIEIENTLKAKKEAYDKEQERIKHEEEARKMQVFQERYDELTRYGITTDLAALRDMSDEWFRMLADMHKKKWEEAEKVRIAQEAETKRLAEEAEQKRQAELEEARKLKEENDRKAQELAEREKAIQDKENEEKRQEELKQAQEKAREEERQRIESERITKEQADLAEKQRMEKEVKYKEWLTQNGVTEENKSEFKPERV